MSARLLVGTASWADKPLVESGRFYPDDATTPEARLRYYASRFPLVEADTTYYGLPTTKTSEGWVERTPDGFTFDVKAYSLFTEHATAVKRLPKEIQALLPEELASKSNLYRKDTPPEIIDACWQTFVDGLMPLHEAGKLGVVVFQFPKWVFPNKRTRTYFEELRERLGTFRAAVEFRNDIWMSPEERENTAALLGDLNFTYICVDEPQGFRSSVPPISMATSDIGFRAIPRSEHRDVGELHAELGGALRLPLFARGTGRMVAEDPGARGRDPGNAPRDEYEQQRPRAGQRRLARRPSQPPARRFSGLNTTTDT